MSSEKRPFSRKLILTVYNGKDRLLTKAFENGPVVIGRQPGCDMILEFPFVSRVHCQVVEEGGNFFLVDLNSRNGLIVNGRRTDKYPLFDGITFELEQLRVELKAVGQLQPAHSPSTQESIETVVARRPGGWKTGTGR